MEDKRKNIVWLGLLAAIGANITFGKIIEARASGTCMPISALLCLTGECAEWGGNSVKGLQLAADEINEAGGVLGQNLCLVVQDSQEADGGGKSVSAL